VGENVTLTEQDAPAASVAGDMGQLLLCLKSPVAWIEAIARGTGCWLVTWTVLLSLVAPIFVEPKVKELGDNVTGKTPEPLRDTAREEGLPESVTVSVPLMGPTAVGVNVKEIVQDLPAASRETQVVLLTANGPPVPVVMRVMEMAAVVLFVTVAFFAALVLLIKRLPKERLVGETDTWPCARPAQVRTATTAQSFIAAGTKLDAVFADDVDVRNP